MLPAGMGEESQHQVSNPKLSPVLTATLLLGSIGSLGFVGLSMAHAVISPASTDFAGFDAAIHVAMGHLGCVYLRPVQLAGARAVSGLIAPVRAARLPWKYNEPLALSFLVYPLSHLPLAAAVAVWVFASAAALGASGVLMWRQRGAVAPLLAFAVIVSLLCNDVTQINFWLAQNDPILLLIFLFGLARLRGGHEVSAGLLFGIVALKPQLVFLVFAVLLFQHRWRVAAAMFASAVTLWAVSLVTIGSACAVTYFHSASALGELEVSTGLPTTLADLTHKVFPSEVLFAVLSVCAVGLLWRLRKIELELAIAVALAFALAIGLHVLWYDMLFLAPLGMLFARRFPLTMFAMGWLFSMALLTDEVTRIDRTSPVSLLELGLLAVAAATVMVIKSAQENSGFGPSLAGWLAPVRGAGAPAVAASSDAGLVGCRGTRSRSAARRARRGG